MIKGSLRNKRNKHVTRRNKNKNVYDAENDSNEEEMDEIEVSESISHHRRRFELNSLVPNTLSSNNKNNKSTTNSKTKNIKATGLLRGQGQWLNAIPKTGFECSDRPIDGVYADLETGCQVWHVCQNGVQHSFLCPAGTIFNAKNGVCDWWYNTSCA